MKKIFTLVITVFLVISLSACGDLLNAIPSTNSTSTSENSSNDDFNFFDDSENSKDTETENYPQQITAAGYTGPDCWLICEPITTTVDSIYEVYSDIDTNDEDWKEQVKSIIELLDSKYNNGESVSFKIFNDTDDITKKQPTYEDLIAIWENEPFTIGSEPEPTIIWYPNGGGGASAEQEREIWAP